MPKSFQLPLAPHTLWQAILDEIGSCDRQLGRFGGVLEVLLKHIALEGLSRAEQDALDSLRAQLTTARHVKQHAEARA
jgi:hypothetical protein